MRKLFAVALLALALAGVVAVSALSPEPAYADGGNHGYSWR